VNDKKTSSLLHIFIIAPAHSRSPSGCVFLTNARDSITPFQIDSLPPEIFPFLRRLKHVAFVEFDLILNLRKCCKILRHLSPLECNRTLFILLLKERKFFRVDSFLVFLTVFI
jgi:hypothetical protein